MDGHLTRRGWLSSLAAGLAAAIGAGLRWWTTPGGVTPPCPRAPVTDANPSVTTCAYDAKAGPVWVDAPGVVVTYSYDPGTLLCSPPVPGPDR